MMKAVDQQSIDEILEKPWDIGEPSYTLHTKRIDTFIRFLEQPDSNKYTLEMDAVQVRMRLSGPNANEIVLRVNCMWHEGLGKPKHDDCKRLVGSLRTHPQNRDMAPEQRTKLAAQVAMFLNL